MIETYDSLNIVESEELKEEKKQLKEDIKDHEKDFLNEIKSLNLDDKILELILNFEDIENEHLWEIRNYEYLCNTWKHEKLEEYKKRYKQVSERLKDLKTKQMDMLKIALKKKEINYINYNSLYDKDKTLKAINKDMLITYKIRDYIIKIKGKERDVYLSDKFKLELLEYLQKEKSLSKLSPNTLDKHLKLIYSISKNNKTDKIKSIKKSI